MTEVADLNDRIKQIRKNHKLKHLDIANITGYSINTVKKWFTDSESKYYQVAPIQALKLMEQWITDGALLSSALKIEREFIALAETWALMNHKGGTAKTTSTINLGLMLAKMKNKLDPSRNNRVLLVDADYQQNLSKSLITFPSDLKLSVSDLVRLVASGKNYKFNRDDVNYSLGVDLLAATDNMSSDIAGIESHELIYTLKESLVWFKEYYDYILIDGLPSKGSWYVAVMAAADKIIIPFTPNKFDIWGVGDVFDHVKRLRYREINKNVRVSAVFCSEIARPFRVLDSVIVDEVKERYPKEFCPTLIRSSVKVKEGCDSFPPQSVVEYAPASEVASEYKKVLDFIMNAE